MLLQVCNTTDLTKLEVFNRKTNLVKGSLKMHQVQQKACKSGHFISVQGQTPLRCWWNSMRSGISLRWWHLKIKFLPPIKAIKNHYEIDRNSMVCMVQSRCCCQSFRDQPTATVTGLSRLHLRTRSAGWMGRRPGTKCGVGGLDK